MSEISFIFAFSAGLVSFLSPCVLPIIPGFLAYLASSSVRNAKTKVPRRLEVFFASIFFVLGFSVVFATLGVFLNTVLSDVSYEVQTWLSRIGGAVIILFGLYLTELVRIPLLEVGHTFRVKRKYSSTHITSFVFGATFAVGWTPCVGAVLGAILGLAASQPASAFGLLLTYSLGLGLPFLAVGFFADRATGWIRRYAMGLHFVSIAFGYLLIALGMLVFTESLASLASFEFINDLILQ